MRRISSYLLVLLLSLFYVFCNGQSVDAKQIANITQISNIDSNKLSNGKVEDLALLCKVWGFLKYYHPSVATGKYDWDAELLRILPEILDCKTVSDRNTAISKWIDNLGNLPRNKSENRNKTGIKLQPDFGWMHAKDLDIILLDKLEDIKTCKKEKSNFYIGLEPGVGNPIFKNEKAYSEMKYPGIEYRLLSLYRYWNIIQYFYPNKHLIDENWNDVLIKFIPKFINAANLLEYKLAILALITSIHDTHANIWGDYEIMNFKGDRFAPVEISFIEGKAVVTDYFDDELGKKTGLQKGDVIVSINQKSVAEIIKEKQTYIPASNYPTQLREIARELLQTKDSVLTVTYDRDGSVHSALIRCYYSGKANINKNYLKKDTCFKMISNDIAYLYPGTIKNKYLPVLMPSILKTKGLIIDLRCYPSEFIVFSLSQYLMPKPTPFVKFTMGDLNTPGLFTFSKELKVGKENPDYYKGKVVILVNETTQSQAEYTAMALRKAPGATVVGCTTAGADGNVSDIYLPGGIRTWISGIGVYYPDGQETQRIGIVPDVEVKPTLKGVVENKDELLEKAVELIEGKK